MRRLRKEKYLIETITSVAHVEIGNGEIAQIFLTAALYQDDLLEACDLSGGLVVRYAKRFIDAKREKRAQESFINLIGFLAQGRRMSSQEKREYNRFVSALGWKVKKL